MTSISMIEWPEELLSNVFSQLEDDTDAIAIRSTCHHINRKTFYAFTQRFFRIRTVRFTLRSLQNLVAVASDENFAPIIRSLDLHLERWNHRNLHAKLWKLTKPALGPDDEDDDSWMGSRKTLRHPFDYERMRRRREGDTTENEKKRREEDEEIDRRIAALDLELAERLRLMMSDEGHLLLRSALEKLMNLRAVKLVDHSGMGRDGRICFDAGGAINGTPCGNSGAITKSWPMLGDQVGGLARLQMVERHSLFTDLLRSLPSSAVLPHLTVLDVCFTEFELTHKPLVVPGYLASQLSSLTATFTGCGNDFARRDVTRYGPPEAHAHYEHPTKDADWLVKWVNSCQKLTSLTLKFPIYRFAPRVSSFAGDVKVPSLEHFSLSGNNLDFRDNKVYNELTTFLNDHRSTLKSLDLADIYLSGNLDQSFDNAPGPDKFLRNLSTFDTLEKVSFARWREKPNFGDGYGRSISFLSSEGNAKIFEDYKRVWTFAGSVGEVSEELLRVSAAYTSSIP